MGIRMTPIDERHFRPDPEGRRKFVLHDWPAADIGTKREFDLARSQAATSNAAVSEGRVYERGASAVPS
jgi:hypothetical protein